jgi:hypothetical protein
MRNVFPLLVGIGLISAGANAATQVWPKPDNFAAGGLVFEHVKYATATLSAPSEVDGRLKAGVTIILNGGDVSLYAPADNKTLFSGHITLAAIRATVQCETADCSVIKSLDAEPGNISVVARPRHNPDEVLY